LRLNELTICDLISDNPCCNPTPLYLVVGTVWGLYKASEAGKLRSPNVLLIDEAGQLSVATAAVVIANLSENDRLIGNSLVSSKVINSGRGSSPAIPNLERIISDFILRNVRINFGLSKGSKNGCRRTRARN
jgi:hypothetical protein